VADDAKKRKGRGGTAGANTPAAEPVDSPTPAKVASTDKLAPPGVTPSMAQFLEIKAANPDCLLFYRMGDFYELFFEDAVAAAQALGIVLTKRGKHLGHDIPMCGVPIHRADEYLQRLIRQGFRVAVCEQLEDPAEARKRGSKAVVRRDVVRLVTPGTLTEDSLLDAKARNYLTAVFTAPKGSAGAPATIALASLDISTGEFEVGEVPAADFPGEIVRLSPSEVIAADRLLGDEQARQWIGIAGAAATPVPGASFDSLAGERLLKAQLGVADLQAFGAFSKAEFAAIGALLKYVELTQIGRRPCLRPPRRAGPANRLVIDAPSRASLELLRSLNGAKQGSLLAAIDRTVTGPGARELAARLSSPLRDAEAIAMRLDAVGFLRENDTLRDDLRRLLRAAPDIARAIARLALQRGEPRDFAAVREGLAAASACASLLRTRAGGIGLPDTLAVIAQRLTGCSGGLHPLLARALVDAPPHLRRDGGFVRSGHRADLDEARALRDDSRKVMAQQYPGLLRRGAGRRIQAADERTSVSHLPPPPDHGRGRPLHDARADRDREPHRRLGRARARHRAGGVRRACRRRRCGGAGAWGSRCGIGRARLRGGPRRAGGRAGLRAAPARRQRHLRDPRRAPSRRRAGAESRQGRRLHRQ
jgi:DNA mismatch repair protein MutS